MGHVYSRLTAEDRTAIAALRKAKIPVAQIAAQLGRPRQTIYAELRRNTGKRGYRSGQAQRLAQERQSHKPRPVKLSPQTIAYIEGRIRLEHSPEQIARSMASDKDYTGPAVSHETMYLHIYADKAAGGTLHTHLRQRRKKRKPRRDQPDRRGKSPIVWALNNGLPSSKLLSASAIGRRTWCAARGRRAIS